MKTFEDLRPINWRRRPSKILGTNLWIGVFLAVHIPLALLMQRYPEIATGHALVTLVVGLWWAVSRSKPDRAIYVCAYITGAEVLWRMLGANVFWEFGKYAIAAIFIAAILRARRMKPPIPIVAYFLLLLPSAGMVLAETDFVSARSDISFNLSGPFTLMISAWFFSRITISRQTLLRAFTSLIGPVIGIASITLSGTLRARAIQFANESNLITSGGFGPNQVSAILGLSAVLCFFFLLEGSLSRKVRGLALGLLVLFSVQSALTFSRGGLFIAFTSAMLTSMFLMTNRRARVRLFVLAVVLFLLGTYVVLPKLDEFTQGNLMTRFRNTAPTRRDVIVADDLQTWEANPLLGVGPGQTKSLHQSFHRTVAAHTEYSRLVAEHGLFGLVALVLLVVATVRLIVGASSPMERVVKVMIVSWSFLFMLGDAMRLAAPAFMLGLAFATLFPETVKAVHRSTVGWSRYVPLRGNPKTLAAMDLKV